MSPIPWSTDINFASALLLHSCLTILLKEFMNALELARRIRLRAISTYSKPRSQLSQSSHQLRTSAVLDAYTSVCSLDQDGEQAELYFTNTGAILLAVSLASSVAMNLLLPNLVLDMIVAGTFGLCFVASLVVGKGHFTLPIAALRRAGRFVWSDTPFVNFFSLIYIATVLRGRSVLRLQDYITFRIIAVCELTFMKAKLAASNLETQEDLMRRLCSSEWVVLSGVSVATDASTRPSLTNMPQDQWTSSLERQPSAIRRDDIVAFQTAQRLLVMLLKTSIGYHNGCLQGPRGPSLCPLPAVGQYIDNGSRGWKIYRVSEDTMLLADSFANARPRDWWSRFLTHAHGVILRRLGKVRVVYLIRDVKGNTTPNGVLHFHSNANLVTGVTTAWLESAFKPGCSEEYCIVAG